MIYYVSSGTLNPTHSLTLGQCFMVGAKTFCMGLSRHANHTWRSGAATVYLFIYY